MISTTQFLRPTRGAVFVLLTCLIGGFSIQVTRVSLLPIRLACKFASAHCGNLDTEGQRREGPVCRRTCIRSHDDSSFSVSNDNFKIGQDTHEAAISAAWDKVRESVREGEDGEVSELDAEHLHWFLGLLEGRLGFAPPPYWRARLLRAMPRDWDGLKILFGPVKKPRVDEVHREFGWLRLKRGWDIESKGDAWIISKGGEQLVLSKALRLEVRELIEGPIGYIALSHDKENWYVALHQRRPIEPLRMVVVMCLNKESRQPVWTNGLQLNVARMPSALTGAGDVKGMEMVVRDNMVFVFGISGYAAHFGALNKADGSKTLHFSTAEEDTR